MTKYVQGKDGKFAGSIGTGKTTVPTPNTTPKPYIAGANDLEMSPTDPASKAYEIYQAHQAKAARREAFTRGIIDADDELNDIRETLDPDDDMKVAQNIASPLWDARRYAQTDDYTTATEHLNDTKRGADRLVLNNYEAEQRIKTLINNIPDYA